MTITEFLLARIAEDEDAAGNVSLFVGVHPDFSPRYQGIRPRVLAECEAKRRIVTEHSRNTGFQWPDEEADYCGRCGTPEEYPEAWPCDTIRALALPYAEHPDYREEWRVS